MVINAANGSSGVGAAFVDGDLLRRATQIDRALALTQLNCYPY
jgi:hypothetical protein